MATLIIFATILLVLTMLFYYRRVRQYYIDQSIYELRQCRHDILMYLGSNMYSLKSGEVTDLKEMYNIVNDTHDMFLKIGGLKFKTIRIIINNAITSAKVETRLPQIVVEKPELFEGYANAVRCSLKAIPLLKVRLITHIVKVTLLLLIAIGFKNGKRNLAKFEQFIYIENQTLNNNAENQPVHNHAC
jgi:hypothetical protein